MLLSKITKSDFLKKHIGFPKIILIYPKLFRNESLIVPCWVHSAQCLTITNRGYLSLFPKHGDTRGKQSNHTRQNQKDHYPTSTTCVESGRKGGPEDSAKEEVGVFN